ncbi:hypothetical protein G6F64_014344 [Rhizopus arrhizus]|uniref:Uncharacterized protein n=1 Tax=Rhizopus oryzae TaxID=64495 RepID=A0A9P7BJ23_RHIOR|nr:hypothetical protein G6F64_014344 [Rhizopus arrhizus]
MAAFIASLSVALPSGTARTSAPSIFMRVTLAVQRADRGGGDPVLAGAGFCNDARLSHPSGQQDLAQAVVDLVRAGVVEVFPLQEDAGPQLFADCAGMEQRAGAAHVRSRSSRAGIRVSGM